MKTNSKAQKKKIERKIVVARPAPQFFEIPISKVEKGTILNFGKYKEVVVNVHPEIYLRALGRQSNNIIYAASYSFVDKNIYQRFISPSVKGISHNYDSLDKKLAEAGL